jgi:hypothetical protein
MTRACFANRLGVLFFLLVCAVLIGCAEDTGDGDGDGDTADAGGAGTAGSAAGAGGSDGADPVDEMLAELEDGRVFIYLDQFTPSSEETIDNVTKYRFEVTPDGPQCIDSSEFGVSVRDQGSENLVIFLMGGGACWEGFAMCTNSIAGQINALDNNGGLPTVNPTDADFPTASWNHVMVPFCDGSLFVGDHEADLFDTTLAAWGEGTEVMHGLHNISAAMDVAKSRFPEINRIFLTGTSAGGFGTIWAAAFVRKLWRDAEVMVFNDAGLGVAKPNDPEFREWLVGQYGAEGRIPESCQECLDSEHLTPLVSWGLEHDSGITATGAFSSYGDFVIAGTFLGLTEAEFKPAILEETGKIHDAFPDRFRRFFVEGTQHTSFGSGWNVITKDGINVRAWLAAMIDGDLDGWPDLP